MVSCSYSGGYGQSLGYERVDKRVTTRNYMTPRVPIHIAMYIACITDTPSICDAAKDGLLSSLLHLSPLSRDKFVPIIIENPSTNGGSKTLQDDRVSYDVVRMAITNVRGIA